MINKVILVGRICTDLELRQTPSGASVCSFMVACNRPYTPKDGGERQADFIPVVAWRTQADFVSKYFAKGNAIGIEGSLQSRSYQDKEGNKRTSYDVNAERITFVESKSSAQAAPSQPKPNNYNPAPAQPSTFANGSMEDFATIDDDDLPF